MHPNPRDLLSNCDWSYAALGGHLHVLKWLLENNYFVGGGAWNAAAEKGHLEVLRLLKEHQFLQMFDGMEQVQEVAATNGHLAVLKWLKEIGAEFGPKIMSAASWSGNLATLKWVREMGSPWTATTFARAAASNGGWEMLMWLKEQGCPGYQEVLSEACEGGFLDIAIWAKENGCFETLNDINFCRLAAEGGHLKMLKWLREQGFPWDCLTTYGAGKTGHADVFFWAVENGCPLGRPLQPTNE